MVHSGQTLLMSSYPSASLKQKKKKGQQHGVTSSEGEKMHNGPIKLWVQVLQSNLKGTSNTMNMA